MHSIAKRELIKKGIEITDAIVTVFELDDKIDNIVGMPWKSNDKKLIIKNNIEIEELTMKYNLINKGDEIYKQFKNEEKIDVEKEKVADLIALTFCIIVHSFTFYLFIRFLLSI